jgi:hypothetical protein
MIASEPHPARLAGRLDTGWTGGMVGAVDGSTDDRISERKEDYNLWSSSCSEFGRSISKASCYRMWRGRAREYPRPHPRLLERETMQPDGAFVHRSVAVNADPSDPRVDVLVGS